MNTLGIRACTGTGGGGDTYYLTGCVGVDVDLLLLDVDVDIDSQEVDVGNPAQDANIDSPVYNVDVSQGDTDVDVTIECAGVNSEC